MALQRVAYSQISWVFIGFHLVYFRVRFTKLAFQPGLGDFQTKGTY
jgi:hypothetical protein